MEGAASGRTRTPTATAPINTETLIAGTALRTQQQDKPNNMQQSAFLSKNQQQLGAEKMIIKNERRTTSKVSGKLSTIDRNRHLPFVVFFMFQA